MKVQFTHHWFHELTLQQGHLDHGVKLSLNRDFPKTGISSRFWLYQGLYKSSIKAQAPNLFSNENCDENGASMEPKPNTYGVFFKLRCPKKRGSRSQLPGGCETTFQKPTDLYTPENGRKKQQKNGSHFSTTIGWWYLFWKIPPQWFWNIYVNLNVGPGKNICF